MFLHKKILQNYHNMKNIHIIITNKNTYNEFKPNQIFKQECLNNIVYHYISVL